MDVVGDRFSVTNRGSKSSRGLTKSPWAIRAVLGPSTPSVRWRASGGFRWPRAEAQSARGAALLGSGRASGPASDALHLVFALPGFRCGKAAAAAQRRAVAPPPEEASPEVRLLEGERVSSAPSWSDFP